MRSFPSPRPATAAVVLFCLTLLAAPAAGADEKKPADTPAENPRFTHWAKFKTGSSITMTGEVDAGGQKVQTQVKTTLVEVAKDAVTVETVISMNLGGQEHAQPARKEVIKAATAGETMKLVAEEEVTVAGKALKCKVYEFQKPGQKETTKVWVSDVVPSGAVKMSMNTPQGKVTFTAKEFEAK
jgi:hypothetical protein